MATSTSSQPSEALIGGACHFLAIPTEIRLQIYLLLLLFSSPMDLGFRGCFTYMQSAKQRLQLDKHTASILFCCRTIRSEALPVFYTKNSFSICARTDLTKYYTSPYSTPLKLSLIRHLVVHTGRHKDIMDETRAEEMKCFVGLQGLTVVQTRVYTEVVRRFVKRSVKEICHGTTSTALKAMLTERPHITCQLVLVIDNYGASHPVSRSRQLTVPCYDTR